MQYLSVLNGYQMFANGGKYTYIYFILSYQSSHFSQFISNNTLNVGKS